MFGACVEHVAIVLRACERDSMVLWFQLPAEKRVLPHIAVVKLLERVTQAGVEFVKTEGLYNFDGKAGYAKG